MSGIPAGAGQLIGKRLGKYEILALLALGGTAEIYLARIGGAAGFEKYVVVKALHDHLADDQEFVKMFLDEARLAAVLDHSNIVQTFELGEHENRYYMVMEFLAGLSLAMIVRRAGERLPGGKIPAPLVLNVAAQACAGLHYTHERQSNGKPLNMVHRDISPQNLVVSFEGVVKVVDFGIARAELRETKTKAGTIKGKFAYMSPEQCVATNVDRRTDVFALGVIVHELLTGRRLFKRNSPYETYQAVLECAVEPPSKLDVQLDPALDDIVMKALTKDKEARYPSAEAFGDAMLKYLHQRARASGPAEMSRFLDQHFAQEIDEHSERMRELMEGRVEPVDTGVGWGEDDEEKKPVETVDISNGRGGDVSIDLSTGDISEMRTGDEDEEQPAEKTRIEANPLERIKELEKVGFERKSTSSPAVGASVPSGSVTNGPAPLPAPPAGPRSGKAVDAGKVSDASGVVTRGSTSGKFPDLANLPTVIADDDAKATPPELARTELGGARVPAGDAVNALAQTAAELPRAPMQPVGAAAQNAQQQPHANQPAYANQPAQANQPAHAMPQARPVVPMGGSQYPVLAGGRPYSTDLAPSDLPAPQRSPFAGVREQHLQQHHDPQHAAAVMSPVGEHFGQQVDWAAAAARPAKALPPWMLALLFVGALGVALMITIIIAKIIR